MTSTKFTHICNKNGCVHYFFVTTVLNLILLDIHSEKLYNVPASKDVLHLSIYSSIIC